MNGTLPDGPVRPDLRVSLARAGIRTWGLDYRSHAVPPDASAAELQTLAGWTADVFAGDAGRALALVRATDAGPLVVAGFSYGAGIAYRPRATRHSTGS